MRRLFHFLIAVAPLFVSCAGNCSNEKKAPEDFVLINDVIEDAMLDIRYYGTYNFIGERIRGYEQPVAILTRQAADSLKAVSEDLKAKGYIIRIYDAYRPQTAVDFFMKWAVDTSDVRTKAYFYPELEKSDIVPQGYVARKSSHTRGSTVDLTLFDMKTGREVDMGCTFDYFGTASHPGLLPGQKAGAYKPIDERQYRNRMILREAMLSHGFKPYECEWWHFTLADEPYPDTYFDFPVSEASIQRRKDTYNPGDVVPETVVGKLGTEAFFTEGAVTDDIFKVIYGKSFKKDCTLDRGELRYLRVLHKDANGRTLVGEIICNRLISAKLLDIFRRLYDASYPIESVRLVDYFDADDEKSMAADNSSSFNFRRVAGSKSLSQHSYGLAVDINPFYNPYYKKYDDGREVIQPEGSAPYLDRSAVFAYKIDDGDLCVELFKEHGFEWGGDWKTCKDYQHFEFIRK